MSEPKTKLKGLPRNGGVVPITKAHEIRARSLEQRLRATRQRKRRQKTGL